jgi:hypothetical protein
MLTRIQPARTRSAALALALLLPLAASAAPDRPGSTKTAKSKPAPKSCAACLEKGTVLDPGLFAQGYEPEVRLAYAAAQKYPDLIDRIHCFCECKESTREKHKTLLTCFTNSHAAACGICQHEAIMAAQLKDRGASDDEVEITVESLHKTEGHRPTFGRGL